MSATAWAAAKAVTIVKTFHRAGCRRLEWLPHSAFSAQRHRQQQRHQKEDVIETQHHVLGTEVNQGQEAAEAAGRGQIEDLMA